MDILSSNTTQKQCCTCQVFLPATPEYFARNKSKKDGFQSQCKQCQNATRRQRYAEQHPQQPLPDGVKQCCTCKDWKPATPEHFVRDKSKKDGLHTKCKQCTKEYKKQHYQEHKEELSEKHKVYQQEHKEQLREKSRVYQQEHKEQLREKKRHYTVTHKDEKRAYDYLYRRRNRESIREKKRLYAEQNQERLRVRRRRYYETHQEVFRERRNYYWQTEQGRMVRRASHQRRRAQKRSAPGNYTATQLQEQKLRQRNRCYYCKQRLTDLFHVDHIVPLSRGGSNDIHNIVITCPSCNLCKQDKFLHEWAAGGRLL